VTTFGYTCMGEQTAPLDLVEHAVAAEAAGFEVAVFSDHFHPWLDEQGQSPFTWSVLGAVAARTERLRLMTMVTCPIGRYHPAIVAQAAATVQILSGGRFTLGLGAGELLNEHVVGGRWPSAHERHEQLEEAIEIIRRLFAGGDQRFRGRHFQLVDARLYSLPDEPPPIALAAGGPEAAAMAAELADGMIVTEPLPELAEAYGDAGGAGPRWGQVAVCYHEDEAEARRIAHARWRFAVPGWKVMAELPNPVNFEAATKTATEDDVAELVACGPDPERHVEAIQRFVDAGYDHVAVVQAGDDQAGFCASGRRSCSRGWPAPPRRPAHEDRRRRRGRPARPALRRPRSTSPSRSAPSPCSGGSCGSCPSTASCTSRSGTGSAASYSATATRSTSAAATAGRWPATSPRSSRRCARSSRRAWCSTPRSCSSSTAGSTSRR